MALQESPWANVDCDNTAFVFLTPNANTDSAAALVEKVFATHNLSVLRVGELSCDTVASENMLDTYYSAWSRFDKKTAAKSRHFADVMENFQKAFGGASYTEVAKKGMVYNPTEACSVLNLTPAQLNAAWKANKSPEVVVTSGIVMKKFPQFDNKWIINGFFPQLRASLTEAGRYIRWWVVQWPEKDMEWYVFRDKVIGNKDLTKARPDSIRGVLFREWKSLGLRQEPDLLDSGVHGSGGPLEGLAERQLFTKVSVEDDELGKVIKNRYAEFGLELAMQWAVNNRISLNDEPFRPAYDVCENFQTYDFLDTIEQNILNDEAYLRFREKQARAPWADYPFLDTEPEGISLEIVWPYLIEDSPFKRQDAERNRLKKPRKPDLKAIKVCEVKMNERNHAIAKCLKLWPFLDQMPEGLSLATVIVYLVEDPEFKIFDQKRIALKKDPQANAAAIKMFEEKMNERNHEVAKILKAWPFLHPMPEGIPLNVVLPHLIKDTEFKALDVERLDLLKDPTANEAKIKAIEQKMDEKNHAIAKCLKGGWPFLDPFPEDIPLPTVIPFLKIDPEFLKMDRERLRLIDEDYFGNLTKIKAMEVAMNDRSHAIAKLIKMFPFLSMYPEGIPLDIVLPYLLKDKAFLANDKERLALHSDPAANKAEIKKREEKMNERNHEIAKALKDYPFLDPLPEGLVLAFVLTYLKHDPDFLRHDEERINLMKDPVKNADQIRELELLMDERNHIVARALKEWPFLHPMPEGILLANVLPFLKLDDEFTRLDKDRLSLMTEPITNASQIKEVEGKMDARSHAVARAMKEYAFLSQMPEGLSLATVLPHLKASDPEFNSMDQQRKALIAKAGVNDASKIADEAVKAKVKSYEEKMNVRNHTMAIILKDYQFLDKVPEALPLATVFPYLREDPKFKRYDKERIWLRRSPASMGKNAARIRELEILMNDRNHVVAKAMKDWPFLEPSAGGLPLAAVLLPAVIDRRDPEFFSMIHQRTTLLKDPLTNKDAIKAVEGQMNACLDQIGRIVRDYPFLDPFPEGVSLIKLLPELKKRDAFQAYEYERSQWLGKQFQTPPEANWEGYSQETLAKIAAAEAEMNKINAAVAYDYYAFLTQDPEGLALKPTVLPTLKCDYLFGKRERKRRYLRAKINKQRIDAANKAAMARAPPDNKPLTLLEEQQLLYIDALDALREYYATLTETKEQVAAERAIEKLTSDYTVIATVEKQMDERNFVVAEAMRVRPYLNKEPEGISIGMVLDGLLQDPEFVKADATMQKLLGDKYFDTKYDVTGAEAKRAAAAKRMQARIDHAGESVAELLLQAAGKSEDDLPSPSAAAALDNKTEKVRVHRPPTAEEIQKDPKLKQCVERMNLRNVGLASALKEFPFLDPVPVRDEEAADGMALDSVLPEVKLDAEFAALAKERRKLFDHHGIMAEIEHEEALDSIEEKMRERCRFVSRVIYERMKLLRPDEEYPFLDILPEGIPVRKVIPYLKQDAEFMAYDAERLNLIAINEGGKYDAEIKGLEEAMNARNHAVAATLKYWPFLDQFPEGIALSYVLPHLKLDPAFIELNKKRLALLKDSSTAANDEKIKAIEREMNERNHAIAKAMKGYPFLDAMPEGLPLDIVFPVLVHDETFKRSDASRMELWAKLPNANLPRGAIKIDPFGRPKKQHSEEMLKLETIMNEKNHEIARAMKAWPFLDPLPEGLTLAHVLPCLILDTEFKRLDKDRIPLLRDPEKNKVLIERLQVKMNERNLAVARALKAYPFLDPLPEGVPISSVIPFLERDEKVFVALNTRRLNLWKDPTPANMTEIRKIESEMNYRSREFARAMKEYPFLDPFPEDIPLCYVLPLLKKDKEFLRMDAARLALVAADPIKNAAKIADLEAAMNDRSHEVAKMLKAYPFLSPMPEGLPLCYVLPILKQDDAFLEFDAERIRLNEDPDGSKEKIRELEKKMDDRSHEIARQLNQYPFLDPVPEGVILSRVLPILVNDDRFKRLDQKRLELMGADQIKNAAAIRKIESEMNDRSHEIAKLLKQYPFLDPLPHGIPLSSVFPALKLDPDFKKYDAERLALMGQEQTEDVKARIKELEGLMNERNLAVALLMKTYPFLCPEPYGIAISVVLPVLQQDATFLALDQERLELMASEDPDAHAGRIRELEIKMDERNHELAKILKLLMEECPFLTPFPEGLSLACIVWPHLSVDTEFCGYDQQRRKLLDELQHSPTANDSSKREKVSLLEALMDERNHAIARMLKAEAEKMLKSNKPPNPIEDEWANLPPGLLEAIARIPYQRKAFPSIKSESAPDDPDRWIDVDFNKRNTGIADWCRVGELYEGPRVGDPLLPTGGLSIAQLEHGVTPECSLLVAIASVLQNDPKRIENLFVSKTVRRDGRYTFQFFKWDRWVRVEIDDMIPVVRDEPLFIRSPTSHWWPLLLEKAYAKFYGSYDNIVNGSIAEALQDITAIPVVSHPMASAETNNTNTTVSQTSSRLKFNKVDTWQKLASDLDKGKYGMALLANNTSNNSSSGIQQQQQQQTPPLLEHNIRAGEGYALRRVHVLRFMSLNDDDDANDKNNSTHRRRLGGGSSRGGSRLSDGLVSGISTIFPRTASPSSYSAADPDADDMLLLPPRGDSQSLDNSQQSRPSTTPKNSPRRRKQQASFHGVSEDDDILPVTANLMKSPDTDEQLIPHPPTPPPRPKSSGGGGEEGEEDLTHILLELYSPHRRSSPYNGPYRQGDAEHWTSEVKKAVMKKNADRGGHIFDENSSNEITSSSSSSSTIIYVPLDVVLRNFAAMLITPLGAVNADPFAFVEAWTRTSCGGNPSNTSWRTNPIYPIRNKSDKPIIVVAQIKQPDQRDKLDIMARLKEGKPNPLNDNHPDAAEIVKPSIDILKNKKLPPATKKRGSNVGGTVPMRNSRFSTSSSTLNDGDAVGLRYLPVGLTLVEQLPPPQIQKDLSEFDHDTSILTHLLVPNICHFSHKGAYESHRDVVNEIMIPPRAQCYLVPSTLDAHCISSFALTVFVPKTSITEISLTNENCGDAMSSNANADSTITTTEIEEAIELFPIHNFPPVKVATTIIPHEKKTYLFDVNVRGVLRLEECQTAEEAAKFARNNALKARVDPDEELDENKAAEAPSLFEDVHVLLRQETEASKEGLAVGDALTDDFMAVVVQGPLPPLSSIAPINNSSGSGVDGKETMVEVLARLPRLVGSMVKGMNYREVAAVCQITQSGTYAVTVMCPKSGSSNGNKGLPVTLSVFSLPGLTYGLRPLTELKAAVTDVPPIAELLRRKGEELNERARRAMAQAGIGTADGKGRVKRATDKKAKAAKSSAAKGAAAPPPGVNIAKKAVQPPPGVLSKKVVIPPGAVAGGKKMIAVPPPSSTKPSPSVASPRK